MPSKAEYYRDKAAECEKKADDVKHPDMKRLFQEAAQHWREMAEQPDRHGW
jgi:hypothetical protein